MVSLLILFLIPFSFAYAESEYMPPRTMAERDMSFDLTRLDFQVTEVKKIFIPKWVDEPRDYSDILKIKVQVKNNGLDNFVIYKNMFGIDVIDPRIKYQEIRRNDGNFRIDNYYPQYIEDFKLRFQDIVIPSSLYGCELIQGLIRDGETREFSVCFDVKQLWSTEPLVFDGPKLYYLVMNDNKFQTSCPNCKITLLNDIYTDPIKEGKASPKTQIYVGVHPEDISCKHNRQLVFKISGEPACVKPSSVEKLTQRGWIKSN